MKRLFVYLFVAVALTMTGPTMASPDRDSALLNQISGYRQWTRVNPDPVKVEVPLTATGGSTSIAPFAVS